jgi:hypothetical protein
MDSYGVGNRAYKGKGLGGTNFAGPGPNANPFELGMDPIDAIDAAAQKHDFAYWKAGASGIQGALFDSKILGADIQLMNEARSIINSYENGGIDNITAYF